MQPSVWTADWTVDSDLAKSLIEESFPALAPALVEPFGEGWDNHAFLVNHSLVFRFPRRKIAASIIETEIRLLPWLSSLLPLQIPNPRYAGASSAHYPCSFAGYPLIAGRVLSAGNIEEQDRSEIARSLGEFFAALHRVPSEQARARGAGTDELGRLDTNRRKLTAMERAESLKSSGVDIEPGRVRELLDSLPVISQPRTDTLVHGDLHAGQMIVNDSRELVGIIDWGDVHLGDPAVDFAAVHALLPRHIQRHFLEAYGSVDPSSWMAARGRAIVHTIALAAQAVDVGDKRTMAEAQRSLDHLLH
jgi:aminoglycoside phosphotransferase (APT) family kinase protein